MANMIDELRNEDESVENPGKQSKGFMVDIFAVLNIFKKKIPSSSGISDSELKMKEIDEQIRRQRKV